ncbi:hypothetical protein D4759_13080 [Clostridiales bacterium AHG0011]|nr:hypothetical protein [Clostridiales bacterium AHG0011]
MTFIFKFQGFFRHHIFFYKFDRFLNFYCEIFTIFFSYLLLLTAIPFLLYTTGLKYIEAGKASVLAFIEPVVVACSSENTREKPRLAIEDANDSDTGCSKRQSQR